MGLFEDLVIMAGTQQGIFYEVDGPSPNRELMLEYYMIDYGGGRQFYHFLMMFYENRPNIVTFRCE